MSDSSPEIERSVVYLTPHPSNIVVGLDVLVVELDQPGSIAERINAARGCKQAKTFDLNHTGKSSGVSGKAKAAPDGICIGLKGRPVLTCASSLNLVNAKR